MHIVVFEDHRYQDLLPLVYWRAVFELRCGWDSLVAKVRRAYADVPVHARMRSSIREVVCEREPTFDGEPPPGQRVLFLNGRLLVTRPVPVDAWPCVGRTADAIVYVAADAPLAERLRDVCWTDEAAVAQVLAGVPDVSVPLPAGGMVRYPWDLVYANGPELLRQWDADGAAGVAGRVDAGVYLLNEAGIHIGENSRIQPCTVIDAEKGPVFIGDGVTVSPNCTIQGPCYIGDGTLIQPGAVVREGTSIGRVCKVGGEVEASIIHGYSNKQHDGFLGHSYLGEWINIGAGCINSDLKNTYGEISVPINGVETKTGRTFVGLTMGDHAKSGVNLSIPTGAVVGFASNVFTSHHAPKFVPSFRWYTDTARAVYDPQRGVAVARKVMARRNQWLSAAAERLFMQIPEIAREVEVCGDGE